MKLILLVLYFDSMNSSYPNSIIIIFNYNSNVIVVKRLYYLHRKVQSIILALKLTLSDVKLTEYFFRLKSRSDIWAVIRYATMRAIVERNTIVLRQPLKFNAIITLVNKKRQFSMITIYETSTSNYLKMIATRVIIAVHCAYAQYAPFTT